MPSIEALTIEADDPDAARAFYAAMGLEQVRVRGTDSPSDGFRGCTLSLVSPQPSAVDALVELATDAGAAVLQPAKKSLWGYGGSVQAPDGTVITLASQSKKDSGPLERRIDSVVLQLGVEDVAASRSFYVERGFGIARSFGRKYVELDTGGVTVSLNARRAVAKAAGVSPDGSGSHRLVIHSDAGSFTDPDGFAWEP